MTRKSWVLAHYESPQIIRTPHPQLWDSVSVLHAYINRWKTQTKQGIHRHQSLRPGVAMPLAPYGPLWPHVTSSIELEVHNITQRRRSWTEPRPQEIAHKILWRSVQRFQRYAHGQTDTQTDRQNDRSIPLPYHQGRVRNIDWYWGQYWLIMLQSCAVLVEASSQYLFVISRNKCNNFMSVN